MHVDREARQVAFIDRLLPYVPLHRVLARSAEALLVSDVELPAPALDIGCGDGTFAAATYDRPLTAGIDPNARSLREAKAHRGHETLVRASGTALPFRDGAFRAAVCNSTLEHIPDAGAVLAETARVLAPGGVFVLTVPSESFFADHLGSTIARTLRLGFLERLYGAWMRFAARVRHDGSPGYWQHQLGQAGLAVLNWRYYLTAASTRAMDAAHYVSAPSLLTRLLLGRWVIWPGKGRFLPLSKWLVRFAREGDGSRGAFLFFHCEKQEGPVS